MRGERLLRFQFADSLRIPSPPIAIMRFRSSHFDAADVADVDVRFAVTQDFEVVHGFVFVALAARARMHAGNVVDVHCGSPMVNAMMASVSCFMAARSAARRKSHHALIAIRIAARALDGEYPSSEGRGIAISSTAP